MTWVYFLKEKSEAFEKFANFQHMVENATREKVTSLITDNGGEFTSTEFNDYFLDNGIERKLKNSYTPQKNGVIERMNRTLMSMERSMM
jgi:transposase InsO family protein